MQTVQLSIADPVYAAALREALSRSGPWKVQPVEVPDPAQPGVLVIDEAAFERLLLPLHAPERFVLITRRDPQALSRAWDAGIVSVLSTQDPANTVILSIMAAALRVPRAAADSSPSAPPVAAPIAPAPQSASPKRQKTN